MKTAKYLIVRVIPSKVANSFIKKEHYSHKVVRNSQLHLGVFINNKLHGVLQFGPSLDKRKIISLVKDTKLNEFIELNRLAFDNELPKNSESRAISISLKLIKKNAPHIKWVISFADGTMCGDGTIYRASGFYLIGIKKNSDLWKLPNGAIEHSFNFKVARKGLLQKLYNKDGVSSSKALKRIGAVRLKGFQFKYIYFLKSSYKKLLTVPIIPFTKIDEINGGMYKGNRITLKERRVSSLMNKTPINLIDDGG